MHNILIVDDEVLICKGLKSMIERSYPEDINEIRTLSNPENVKELVVEFKPHIIITDIMMPQMSGLDLIRNISEIDKNIKFVVLSGYDDFEYVKEAFKLGVQDYLLKPVSIDELKDILNKIMNTIKEEQKIEITQRNKAHRYMEAMIENNFNKLFSSGYLTEESIKDIFEEMNIAFPYLYFSIGGLLIYNKTSEGRSLEHIKMSLEKVIEKLIRKSEINVYYLFDLNNNLIFIFNHSDIVNINELTEHLNMIMNSLKEAMNLECIASISDASMDLKSIITGYSKTIEALSYRIVYGPYNVIKHSDVEHKKDINDAYFRNFEKLKEYILTFNTIGIINTIDKLFNKNNLRDTNIRSINKLYDKFIAKIYEVVEEEKIPVHFNREFKSFNSLSELKIFLKTSIFEFISVLKEKGSNRSISDVVKKYVSENYCKDIDMAVVSNVVSLSYSHFSKIFKDETGMNFSDYLTKVRMEKALEMLSDPVNKVNDIAKNVSYNSPKHFTRAFKNYFGFSPREYRTNMNKEEKS
jgi:two-component system, response regulator YesN